MSSLSNDQGRGYEYAWMLILQTVFEDNGISAKVLENSSLIANLEAFNRMSLNMRTLCLDSANSIVRDLIRMEPHLSAGKDSEVILEFQKDERGAMGDVRDIVIKKPQYGWEIGVSIKHNNDSAKHSRLSPHIDFGKEWLGTPCSAEYKNTTEKIFSKLDDLKRKGCKWSEIPDKPHDVYAPILKAFITEFQRIYMENPEVVSRNLVHYIVGTKDYYKIISLDDKRCTLLEAFNTQGNLGACVDGTCAPVFIPRTPLPSVLEFFGFKPKSYNTLLMRFDKGWELSFRIHNASRTVEPSLKFDIRLIKKPDAILEIERKWD